MTVATVIGPGGLATRVAEVLREKGVTASRQTDLEDPSSGFGAALVVDARDPEAIPLARLLPLLERAADAMGRAEGGRIVVIGSSADLLGLRDALRSAHTTALIGGVRALTVRYADRNVAANVVLSGLSEGDTSIDEAMVARSPLRRLVTDDEVAAATTMLCSSAAAFTHALVLPVDGGACMGRT